METAIRHYGNYNGFEFYLTHDGKFFIKRAGISYKDTPYVERPWFTGKDGQPLMIRTAPNFRSLVKMGINDGDYDDLPKHIPYNKRRS